MVGAGRSRRDALVGEIADLRAWLERAEWRINAAEGAAIDEFITQRTLLARKRTEYLDLLPRPALSRCPFSGEVLTHSIDSWGLDGPWWDADSPYRPFDETPETLIVLSGAMRLRSPIETTAFLVLPGPRAPVVSRTLLEYPDVRAVLSSLAVGPHSAYPIAYFSDPAFELPPTVAVWGTRRWRLPDDDVDLEIEIIEEEDDLDGDLEFWIRRGKLLWIAPDDPELRLHATLTGCPYLGLEGSTAPVRLMDGRLLEVEP